MHRAVPSYKTNEDEGTEERGLASLKQRLRHIYVKLFLWGKSGGLTSTTYLRMSVSQVMVGILVFRRDALCQRSFMGKKRRQPTGLCMRPRIENVSCVYI